MRIIARAKRLKAEIEQIFTDAAWWNDNGRHPHEDQIDPDPDGLLRRLVDGIDRMLADDDGHGPIPPIGGWLDPVFSGRPSRRSRVS